MSKKREVAIGILTDSQGRLFVGRRMSAPYLGKWEMPGGKVENNETVIECLRREFREEGGVELDAIAHWTKIESEASILYLFRVFTTETFVPTIYEEYRFISADELSKLDWIETNRGFLAELRDIINISSNVVQYSFHPTTLTELRRDLTEISRIFYLRTQFSSFSCTIHGDALQFQTDPELTKTVASLNHEGVSFYAIRQPSNLLPGFIKSEERG